MGIRRAPERRGGLGYMGMTLQGALHLRGSVLRADDFADVLHCGCWTAMRGQLPQFWGHSKHCKSLYKRPPRSAARAPRGGMIADFGNFTDNYRSSGRSYVSFGAPPGACPEDMWVLSRSYHLLFFSSCRRMSSLIGRPDDAKRKQSKSMCSCYRMGTVTA